MSITDKLEDQGIQIEKLSADEKQTYYSMLDAVRESQLTPEKLREYIVSMRDAVEEELTKVGLEHEQDTFLKARLKNYRLLEAFLGSSERAQKAFDNAVSGLLKK